LTCYESWAFSFECCRV